MSPITDLMLPFAQSINAKCNALGTLELSAQQKRRFCESISDDIKKCGNFLIPEVSEAAQAKAESLGVDLYSKNWHDQSKFDGSHKDGHFHLEHVRTVSDVRDRCIKAASPEAVHRILLTDLRVAWILKRENKELTRLGYQSRRPDPNKAYAEAGIKIHKRSRAGACKGMLNILKEDDSHLEGFKEYM